MAYSGYLLKVGAVTVPLSKIQAKTYSITPDQVLDLDPYSDANGILKRTPLDHTRSKVEFETIAQLTDDEIKTFLSIFKDAFVNTKERDLYLTYYDTDTHEYKTGHFYMPDIIYTLYSASSVKLEYNAIRVAFIEY